MPKRLDNTRLSRYSPDVMCRRARLKGFCWLFRWQREAILPLGAVWCVVVLSLALAGTPMTASAGEAHIYHVPVLKGLNRAKAVVVAESLGINLVVDSVEFSKSVAKGLILEQFPRVGVIESGRTIHLTLSKGSSKRPCIKCKKELSSDTKFCIYCGAQQPGLVLPTTSLPETLFIAGAQGTSPRLLFFTSVKERTGQVFGGGAAIVVLLVVIISLRATRRGTKAKPAGKTPSSSERFAHAKNAIRVGDYSGAEEILRGLRKQPAYQFEAMILLSELMEKKGDYDLALIFLEEAFKGKGLDANTKKHLSKFVSLCEKTDELDKASGVCRQVLGDVEPTHENREQILQWARIRERLGEVDEARDIYRKLVLRFPDYQEAVSNYRRLKQTPTPKPKTPPMPTGFTETATEDYTQLTDATRERYQFVRELGRGGMGVVYQAKDTVLGRFVALKIMRKEICLRRRDKQRFLKEARIAANLKHGNILTLYDVLEESGLIYLVFEYVEGKSLARLLDDLPDDQNMKPGDVARITIDVCSALGYAHSEGVIHRDIKPSNLMVDRHRRAKVLDFGIARVAEDTFYSMTGQIAGTPGYMAPEQHLGERVDPRTDIFAVGVTLYEMLTGDVPFKGADMLAQKREENYRPASEVCADLRPDFDIIIRRCLRSNRDERFPSVTGLMSALSILGQ